MAKRKAKGEATGAAISEKTDFLLGEVMLRVNQVSDVVSLAVGNALDARHYADVEGALNVAMRELRGISDMIDSYRLKEANHG